MPAEPARKKKFLFVDDDAELLAGIREIFSGMSRGTWEISTAENHAQALAQLARQPVDVVVLDVNMPVMDGIGFLRLLRRTHPTQLVVMFTGSPREETRETCLKLGVALFLEKLLTPQGYEAVFAALDALAGELPQAGFSGMMRRVGLHDVLQMECLARKSSVLEVFTGSMRGRIYITDGSIVHAECGALQGEVALYGLLGLRGGEFNLLPFTEPPRRAIQGQYEFLLMEAARLKDQGTTFFTPEMVEVQPAETTPPPPAQFQTEPLSTPAPACVRIEEVVLGSGAGEVLYQSHCSTVESRLELLGLVEQQALQLSNSLLAGRFDRLEVMTPEGRIVCHIQPHLRLFVRSRVSETPLT